MKAPITKDDLVNARKKVVALMAERNGIDRMDLRGYDHDKMVDLELRQVRLDRTIQDAQADYNRMIAEFLEAEEKLANEAATQEKKQ